MIKLVLRPFSYLQIKHTHKRKIDWMLPIIMSILSVIFIITFIDTNKIKELIISILSFIQILPGFFIAALAAIATFNRLDLDKIMPYPAPTINIERNGGKEEIDLTRRRYLTLMFSFLSAESILLIVLSFFIIFSIPNISNLLEKKGFYYPIIGNIVLIFSFFLCFWQLLIISFYGLYYLGERIHQPD